MIAVGDHRDHLIFCDVSAVVWVQSQPGPGQLALSRPKKFLSKKMADTVELQEAFKLFDMDGDGMITKDELKKLVEKVGGKMTEGEAKGLIHQADKVSNQRPSS